MNVTVDPPDRMQRHCDRILQKCQWNDFVIEAEKRNSSCLERVTCRILSPLGDEEGFVSVTSCKVIKNNASL